MTFEGRLRYKDRDVSSINTDVSYVTQDGNLVPWLDWWRMLRWR